MGGQVIQNKVGLYKVNREGMRPKVELIHNLQVEWIEIKKIVQFCHDMANEENMFDKMKQQFLKYCLVLNPDWKGVNILATLSSFFYVWCSSKRLYMVSFSRHANF